ncbi:hypothetical protein QPK24_17570 [Paenibacillus polygoni]|uniref:Lipoprotein n=1 Tax=Paenibacillus polygoni TaxID=3050112 RepID=A0ABY8X156_9BACL|nr:hypothetical protein [Paenibacillus polygoni]WIV18196.1 hypothetical protein QPK24_17570 [Paenibacillus polygoni]
MNIFKLCKMTAVLSFMLMIAACGTNEAQDASSPNQTIPQENQVEETNDKAVDEGEAAEIEEKDDEVGEEEVVKEDLASAESENEASEQVSAYPFLVWADGGTFKIITEGNLPDQLKGKKLGEVSSTLTDEEVGNLEQGQTYEKLDRADGESNYLKKGSAIYQLKKADTSEVVLVENNGLLHKAVRIGK